MKEYIYFDRQLVNSTLAQIDEGILTKLISGQTTTDTSQEDGGEEITYGANGGLNIAIASTKGEFSKKEIDKFSSVYSGSIIYGTDESELILQPHFHFRY
ncbi:hypothetical protein I5S82_13555 [Enterococcus faecium]|nr:hypothetical protein [Enterococcus faecium]